MRLRLWAFRRHPVARTAFGLYAVQAIVILSPLLTLPYLSRVLGSETLGLLLFSQAFASVVTAIMDFGFDISATRAVARRLDEGASAADRVAGIVAAKVTLALATGLLAVAVGLAIPLFRDNPRYLVLAWLLGVAQGFSSLWFFLGNERIGVFAALDGGAKVAIAVGIFIFVASADDGSRVLVIQALATAVAMAIAIWLMFRQTSFSRIRPSAAFRTLRAGAAMALFRGSVLMHQHMPPLLVGVLSSSLQVSYFGIADKVHKVPIALSYPLSQAIYPRINYLIVREPARAERVIRLTLLAFFGIGVVAAIGLVVAASLIPFVFGEEYGDAIPALRLLALSLPLSLLAHALTIVVLMPLGRERTANLASWAAGGLMIVAALALVPEFGAIGMVIGLLIGHLSYLVLLLLRTPRLAPAVHRFAAQGAVIRDPLGPIERTP